MGQLRNPIGHPTLGMSVGFDQPRAHRVDPNAL